MPTEIPSVTTFQAEGLDPPAEARGNPTALLAFYLRRDIIRGVFRPMERLAADQLATFYSVGYSSMREAILMLSFSNLLTHEHQKGYRVAPTSLADWRDVVAAYQSIYKLTLDRALRDGDEPWEDRVVLRLHRLMKVPGPSAASDPAALERWQGNRRALHDELRSGSGSPVLVRILGDLSNSLERYVNLYGDRRVDIGRDHHAEHRAIVDALVARDTVRLEAGVDRYFTYGTQMRTSVEQRLLQMETVLAKTPARRGRKPKPKAGGVAEAKGASATRRRKPEG